MFEVAYFEAGTCPRTPKLRRGSKSFCFASFVLVKETDKLPTIRLLLRSDFQNEVLRHQINRVTHFDKFLVLFYRLMLCADHAPYSRDDICSILWLLQLALCPIKLQR